jgi:outer membrane receptor protein involved in Fe transport
MIKKIIFLFIGMTSLQAMSSLLIVNCFGQEWQGEGRQEQGGQEGRSSMTGRYSKTSQGVGVVKGKITDGQTGQAVEYSSVVVYKAADSTMAGGAISDEKGAFKIENLTYGIFFVKLNFIGYKPKRLIGISITPKKPVFDVGAIKLNLQSTTLNEVQIIADKPLIEYKLDKKIVNVENNIVTTGGTATDVLQQIPSVTVDIDGNVSLRGNSNVQILIDGKPTLMTQDQLQEIPASQIKSVELITNPSAKYEAEGMAGIIDIKLKNQREKGFNGMLMLNAGTEDKYNGSVNFNRLLHKFNVFGSYDVRSDHSKGYGNSYSTTNVNDQESVIDENDRSMRERISNNFKLGTDYSIDSKNTLTLTGLYRMPFFKSSQYSNIIETGNVNEGLNNYTNGKNTGNAVNVNLDYKRTYDKKDKQLTADAIFNISNRNNSSDIKKEYFLPQTDTIQHTFTDGRNNSTTLKLDYVNPLGEHSKLEAGTQAKITNSDNNYQYESYDNSTNTWIYDWNNLNDHFLYDMQIYSAYGMYSGEYKSYTYQLGLRAEETLTKAIQKTMNETFNFNYFDIYPSVNLTRKIDETQSIQLSYSRRVNRPNPFELNPFVNRSDYPFSISYGNPDLKPEYINSFELSYIKYLKKRNTLTGSIFYKGIDKVIKSIQTVVIIDSNNVINRTFDNLSTGESYGLELIGDIQIIKGWRASVSYSYFKTVINGNAENTQLTNQNYSSTAKLNTFINLPNRLSFQLSVNYRGPQVTPQGEMKEMYFADLAIKKDILKEKATVSLRLSDILNSQKFQSITYTPELQSNSYRKRDSRILYLGFTYRINNTNKTQDTRHKKQDRKRDEEPEEEIEYFGTINN